MRRSLVLTNEAARHWFRASLPPPAVVQKTRRWPRASIRPNISMAELREFLLAYCACFVAFSVFLA